MGRRGYAPEACRLVAVLVVLAVLNLLGVINEIVWFAVVGAFLLVELVVFMVRLSAMAPADRDNPIRANSSESSYSLMEFMREFPDDAACLEWLWRNRFSENGSHAFCPKCDRERKFHKVKERPAWDCDSCGYHMHPLAGTIFAKSSTSLHLWFFAIHLMTSTRCGVSAKQLERELGVTYKTAWRMFTLIRNKLMTEDGRPLTGYVEVDETSVDGKPRKRQGQNTQMDRPRRSLQGSETART